MNNFGRAVLAVGLSAVMTFTGPECFFQSGVEPVSVYAAEEKAVQSKIAGDNSEEGESTTEVTTEKKEESTTATESQESQTSSERDTSSGNKEHSQTEHTTESTKRNTSGTSGNTDQAEDTDSSTSDTSGNSSHSNEEGTTQKIAKKAAAAGLFSTEDEDVFKDLLTSVVNLQLGTAGEDPEKKFSSDEELSEKLGEVLFALCRFCAKYQVSGEMALLKKLEEF